MANKKYKAEWSVSIQNQLLQVGDEIESTKKNEDLLKDLEEKGILSEVKSSSSKSSSKKK